MWSKFWTLFGASNQLLAALSLLTITLWLKARGQKVAFTFLPMLFVLVITFWALGDLVATNWTASQGFDVARLNALAATALVLLAIFMLGSAWGQAKRK